jgi:colicin import membrane protein
MQENESSSQAERKRDPQDLIDDANRKASRIAIGKSLLLHGVILASILVSISFSSKPLVFAAVGISPAQEMEIVKATFIDSNVIEQKRREKAQAEANANERARKQEQARRNEAERERKKRADNARKKREAEQQQEQQRLNALEEQRQKEEAASEAREIEERKKREAQEIQRQLAQEMEEQLEQEQAAMNAAQQQRIMTELERYNVLIGQKITRNLNLDGGFKGKSCRMNMRIAADGLILAVKVLEGDPALCRASQAAALKAESVPMSVDPDVYKELKNTNITIRPNS